jgi:hypothetical protein
MEKPAIDSRLAARWIARAMAAVFTLLWGAFFLHHLGEWYLRPEGYPPAWVTGLMLLHFGLLAGLVTGFRWELAGGLLALASGGSFFCLIGAWKIWYLWVPTLVPGLIWIWLGLARAPEATTPTGSN